MRYFLLLLFIPQLLFAEEPPSGFFSEDFVRGGSAITDTTPPLENTEPQAPTNPVEPTPPEMPQTEAESAQPHPIEPPVPARRPGSAAIDMLRGTKMSPDAMRDRFAVIEQLRGSAPTSKPVLSLLVAGFPQNHLAQYVDYLAKARRLQNIEIGELVVVFNDLSPDVLRRSGLLYKPARQALEELHDAGVAIRVVRSVPERFRLKYSPTWIVRHNEVDHIFEGYRSGASFFSRDGEFDPTAIPEEP